MFFTSSRFKVLVCLLCIIGLPKTRLKAQEVLEEGDNLAEYIKTHETLHLKGKTRISSWLEGQINLYATSKDPREGEPLIILSEGKYPFAVIQGAPPDRYYLIDATGDRILDMRRTELFIPFWVVFENSTEIGPPREIFHIMNLLYEALRSPEDPSKNPKMKQGLTIIEQYAGDAKKSNRDLVYLLYFYTRHNREELELSFDATEELFKRLRNRHNQVHPLNLFFVAECLMRLNRPEEAGLFLQDLLTIDPEFVPAKVYQLRLEEDQSKTAAMLEELKSKYGQHWALKGL
jgi:hypothetical protein